MLLDKSKVVRVAGHTTHGAINGGGIATPAFLNRLEKLLDLQITLLIKQQINTHFSHKYGLICFTHTKQGNK